MKQSSNATSQPAMQVNDPSCMECQRRELCCVTSRPRANRCDACNKTHRRCTFVSKNQAQDNNVVEADNGGQSGKKTRRSQAQLDTFFKKTMASNLATTSARKVEVSQTGYYALDSTMQDVFMEAQPADTSTGHALTVPEQPSMYCNQTTTTAVDKVETLDSLQELRESRETFFRSLDVLKKELGSTNLKLFRDVYVSAKMWAAQEDMCLEL